MDRNDGRASKDDRGDVTGPDSLMRARTYGAWDRPVLLLLALGVSACRSDVGAGCKGLEPDSAKDGSAADPAAVVFCGRRFYGHEAYVACSGGSPDLRVLARLPDLESVNLSRTLVADLTPLAKLPKVTELRLDQTKVTDLRPL